MLNAPDSQTCGTHKVLARFVHVRNVGRMAKRAIIIDGDQVLIVLNKGYVSVVDPEDADLGLVTWSAQEATRGVVYAVRRDPVGRKIYLHREIGARAGLDVEARQIDHKDHDGLNNRRLNLRSATRTDNNRNMRRHFDNQVGAKGVSLTVSNRYRARIWKDGKEVLLGCFATVSEASQAYAAAADEHQGEFACLDREIE